METRTRPWRERSDGVDARLTELFLAAVSEGRLADDTALIAVGGYGRREMAPRSDVDVLLLHRSVADIDEVAARIWYPLWDEGFALGHAVRTPKETVKLAASDLDTATGLLTARVVAGNAELAGEVIDAVARSWRGNGTRRLAELHDRIRERHGAHGEVAFMVEPNLKEGLGGLRDIHGVWWGMAAGLGLPDGDAGRLAACNELLLRIRCALHDAAGRAEEVLRLDHQVAVARACGFADDDDLMTRLAEAGRTVAWIADEAWARLDPPTRRSSSPVALAPGIHLRDGEIGIDDAVDVAADPTLLLRVATTAARLEARISRPSLDRLSRESPVWPDPWPAGASDDLVALLLEGHRAIPVLESLDQADLLVRVLPEWSAVRSKPQRNAFHRFTVDRHLWEVAANASLLVDRVERPDLLVLAGLFHDIGKGWPGDHTEVGVEMFARLGPRLGLDDADTAVLVRLIDTHLLLADTATRRDLSDPATITMVAERVGSTSVLDLLHALTEADSLGTGPSAWSEWKADLVSRLVDLVRARLGGASGQRGWHLFPDASVLEMMAVGAVAVRPDGDRVVVVSPDTPGTFARVAGVLALSGLDVVGAEAHSDEQGMAASEFTVVAPKGGADWDRVAADIERALLGRLALDSRLAERARQVRPRRRLSAAAPSAPTVTFDDAASTGSTFIEVRAPDSLGLLHRIARALADLGLDIRHARVLTMGNEVVDSFYVRDAVGGPVTDASHRSEIERALLHAAAPTA